MPLSTFCNRSLLRAVLGTVAKRQLPAIGGAADVEHLLQHHGELWSDDQRRTLRGLLNFLTEKPQVGRIRAVYSRGIRQTLPSSTRSLLDVQCRSGLHYPSCVQSSVPSQTSLSAATRARGGMAPDVVPLRLTSTKRQRVQDSSEEPLMVAGACLGPPLKPAALMTALGKDLEVISSVVVTCCSSAPSDLIFMARCVLWIRTCARTTSSPVWAAVTSVSGMIRS